MSDKYKYRHRFLTILRLMPRNATLYAGLGVGVVAFFCGVWVVPQYAIGIGANAFFIVFCALSWLKTPLLTADYLKKNARKEDTPALGIILIVAFVVSASIISLTLALFSGTKPDPFQVISGVTSVLTGWFTVQTLGALHYAYEYYQAPDEQGGGDSEVEGGLDFPGDEPPNGVAFMYFSFTIGTSVATSDTRLQSNTMRRRVTVHLVFSHLYNTFLLAFAVNVLMSLGGGGGG